MIFLHPFTAEDDVHDVYEEVFTMAGSWRKIAISLRLSPSITELIASQGASEPKYCLFIALNNWLKRMYNTGRYGNPSWHMLVKAVASPTGGANPALAQAIAEKHSGKYEEYKMLSWKNYNYVLHLLVTHSPDVKSDMNGAVAVVHNTSLKQGI